KCGATIVVNSSGAQNGAIADSPSQTGAGDESYLVNVGDGDQRSMQLAEIVNSYHQGIVNAETYVWTDGMGDWMPLGQVDAIVAALHGGAPAPAPTPSQPPRPASAPPPAGYSQPASQPPMAAAGESRAAAVK